MFNIVLENITKDINQKVVIRKASRAIIFVSDMLLMIKSEKYQEYKFPGGGIKENENQVDALIREVLEETGKTITKANLIGTVQEKHTDFDYLFIQDSFYYLCEVDETLKEVNLDGYELEFGYKLELVSIEKALQVNLAKITNKEIPWVKRETEVLKYLLKNKFKEISFINEVISIEPIFKGWSSDSKYILTTNKHKFVLRISKAWLYQKRFDQFKELQKLKPFNLNIQIPIEFGTLENNDVYIVYNYIEGESLEEFLKTADNETAYELGLQAGNILKKIHSVDVNQYSWFEHYKQKINRKVDALLICPLQIPLQNQLIEYYINNSHLLKNNKVVLTHGDFHVGNMVIKNNKIGVIDFDKCQIADLYDDFKPSYWSVSINPYFEVGLIDGYFDFILPLDFFKIFKYYTVESIISHLPWAFKFGQKEIEITIESHKKIYKWYNNFTIEIPSWYTDCKK